MIERPVWYTVMAIGLLSATFYGGRLYGIENQRIERCRDWAELAISMRRDMKAGVIVNVTPAMEAFKEMVASFNGTERELGDFVISDCMGTRI